MLEREHDRGERPERSRMRLVSLLITVVVLTLCATAEGRPVGDSLRARKSGHSPSRSVSALASASPPAVVLVDVTSAATDSSASQSQSQSQWQSQSHSGSSSDSDSNSNSEHRHRRHHRRRRHSRHSHRSDSTTAATAPTPVPESASESMRFHSVASTVASEAQKMALTQSQSQSQMMGQTEALTHAQTVVSGVVIKNPSMSDFTSHKVSLGKIAFGFIIGSVAIFGIFMGWLIQWACSNRAKATTSDYGRAYIPKGDDV